jgi:hypothetical protein
MHNVLWGVLGLVVGAVSSFFTRKALPGVLRGDNPFAALLIGLKLLLHAVLLTIAVLVGSREALLWTAGGDALALIAFAVIPFLSGRK